MPTGSGAGSKNGAQGTEGYSILSSRGDSQHGMETKHEKCGGWLWKCSWGIEGQ